MTKVTEHGNVVVVDDVTTEAQEHDPFYDWWMSRRVDTRILKRILISPLVTHLTYPHKMTVKILTI